MGTTEKRPDGVDTTLADQHDLDSYRQAQADLDKVRIPVLLHASNPHERLYVAALDGTGNSRFDDKPENWSTVAKIYDQIRLLDRQGVTNIAGGYVEGTFTQTGSLHTPERLMDGPFGISFEDRVETAYYQLCVQAKTWIDEDPQAQIRVVGVGFSRGSEAVAALERMIEERGIRNPVDAKVIPNHEGLIAHIQYADKPLLVAPGKTLQAALLFDPVSTGVLEHDRRLPPSTMSTFQITAEDDRRTSFMANDHIPVGFSEDDRNLNVIVGGAHSDVGDTYLKNGLGTLSLNLGIGFLNRLSDHDYLQKQVPTEDPSQYVVHRSDQGMHGLYGTSIYDKSGMRGHVNQLAPAALCKTREPEDCQRKEPISAELETLVERRSSAGRPEAPRDQKEFEDAVIPRVNHTEAESTGRPAWNMLFLKMTGAALNGDSNGIHMAGRAYSQTSEGQAWLGQGQQFNNALAQQVEREQQQTLQQAMMANETMAPRGPVMRM